jgi:hypothetical protein
MALFSRNPNRAQQATFIALIRSAVAWMFRGELEVVRVGAVCSKGSQSLHF